MKVGNQKRLPLQVGLCAESLSQRRQAQAQLQQPHEQQRQVGLRVLQKHLNPKLKNAIKAFFSLNILTSHQAFYQLPALAFLIINISVDLKFSIL